jgi:hypothetical protein
MHVHNSKRREHYGQNDKLTAEFGASKFSKVNEIHTNTANIFDNVLTFLPQLKLLLTPGPEGPGDMDFDVSWCL